MRRGLTAAVAGAALALSAPAVATAACPPGGSYAASVEFQNAAFLFTGQLGSSLSTGLAGLARPSGGESQKAVDDLLRGNAARATSFASALQKYMAAGRCKSAKRR